MAKNRGETCSFLSALKFVKNSKKYFVGKNFVAREQKFRDSSETFHIQNILKDKDLKGFVSFYACVVSYCICPCLVLCYVMFFKG